MEELAKEKMVQNQDEGYVVALDDAHELWKETESTTSLHSKEVMVLHSDCLALESGSAHGSSSDKSGVLREETEQKQEKSQIDEHGEGHAEALVDVKAVVDSLVDSAYVADSSSCNLVYSFEATAEKSAKRYGIDPVTTGELVEGPLEVPLSQPSSNKPDALQGLSPDVVPEAIGAANYASLPDNSQMSSVGNVEISSELPVDTAPVPVGSSDGFSQGKRNSLAPSLTARRLQPSSWKSCCGLFQVLRRSS